MPSKRSYLDEYWKHTALNIGQLVRDFRFFYHHPAASKVAREATIKYCIVSFGYRLRSMGYNTLYAILPPHWHHSAEDLQSMSPVGAYKWFLHGYAPWRFPDPRGEGAKSSAFTI